MIRAALHRRVAAGVALTLALSGAIAVVTTTSAVDADAATVSGLLPPATGILPGPSPSGDTANDGWGPCVPDPNATDNCQGWPADKTGTINGTDDAPNVIVGGDFVATGSAAETEGLLVVGGNASFDKGYNVGWAIGSGVIPADRADWLIVGGGATVTPAASQVQVGTAIPPYRTGDIRVGGTHSFRDAAVPSSTQWGQLGAGVDTGNQTPPTQFQNAVYSETSVLTDDHYDDLFGDDGTMATYSQQCYAPLSDPDVTTAENLGGTLSVTHGTVALSGGTLTLTGPGSGDLVVFDLPATIGSASSPVSVDVTGIPTTSTILLNTSAGGAVSQFVSNITVDGDPNPAPTWRDRILYNYPNATSVRLGGPVQLPGSVLLGQPGSTLTLGVAGTNGRVYTPGDLVNDGGAGVGTNTGTENHAYQFVGQLGCVALVPATFSIQKAITGDGASTVPADTEFTVDWTVTGPSDSPDLDRTGTVTVLANGTPVNGPTDLADGDEVTFSEPTFPTVPGVDWGTPSITPNPVTLGGENSVAAVTVTNEATLQRGGFTIEKSVTGDDGASTTTFTGTWTCDAENADGQSTGTWELADGETVALDGFPVGTTCSVTETAPTDDNGAWESSIDPAGDFTITEGDATNLTVDVTNTFTHAVGGFTIEKTVAGDDGASTTTFTGTWTCDAENADGQSTGAWELADGDTLALDGFPTGTTCSVTEDQPTDDNGTWESSIDPSGPFTITEGDATNLTVDVTNTFTHAVGGFTIRKVVAGDSGASTTTFTGAWTCDAPDADGDASGTWELADGDVLALDGFPTGTTCSVTEDQPTDDNGTWASSIDPSAPFVITEGTSAGRVVTVTNTFTSTVGGFQVEKLVQGDPGASVDEFTIDWSCDQPNADGESSGSVTLHTGEQSGPITGFPVGTECTISEPTVDDSAGTWAATVTPAQVTIGSDDASEIAAVTVTNTFTHAVGGFTIAKRVTGDAGASTTSFDIAWQCSAANADGDDSGTVRLKDGDTATVAGFPTGTTCTVTEETPTDDNGTWRTPTIDPGEITVAEGDGTAQVVTVTNTFVAPTPTPTPTPSGTTPAPTTPAPSTTTPAPAPTSAPTTPGAGGGGLAVTGFDALGLAAAGAFLVAIGLAAVLISRRRHG